MKYSCNVVVALPKGNKVFPNITIYSPNTIQAVKKLERYFSSPVVNVKFN